MIQEQYYTSESRPFIIHTPEMPHVMVTSSEHIRELDKAPRSQLSLHAVAKAVSVLDIILLMQTMTKYMSSSSNQDIP
jgi:hypothetical protein